MTVRPVSPLQSATMALAVAFFAVSAPTAAQDDDRSEEAETYYKRGMEAFYEDDYAIAITNFKRAHNISPSATLLFNISLAYSKMAKPEDALEFAREATEHDDMPDDTRVKNRGRMTGYRVAIRGRGMTGGSGGGTSQTDTGGRALRWVGVSVGVAGAGLLGGALAVGSNVSSKIDEKATAEEQGNFGKANDLYETIRTQQILGQILLYSGIATFAAGTTRFIVDTASGPPAARAIDITGGPTGDGFRVGVDVDF